MFFYIFFIVFEVSSSQNINLNESFIERYFRDIQLLNKLETKTSFTIRPLSLSNYEISDDSYKYYKNIFSDIIESKNKEIKLSLLPIDYIFDYNSHHLIIGIMEL